jgi:uncharacterized protein
MNKLSDYNFFIEHEQRIICFNGMSGYSFSFSKKEYERLKEQFDDLISFQIQYDSVFEWLKKWGFIVDEDTNEIDVIKFRNKQAVMSDKFYRLIINPTEECVFNCWYCTQHKRNTGYMNEEIQDKIKNHIKFMIDKEKITGLYLDWFGGEPLIYFDEVMYPLAEYAFEAAKQHQLPFTHHVTSNAYLINPAIVQKMKEISLKSFQITIDGDEKRHNSIRNINGKPSYKRIMENILLLCEQIPDVNIILRLNFDEKTLFLSDMTKVFECIPQKYRQNISVDFQRVWQTKKDAMRENPVLLDLYRQCISLGYRAGIPGGFELGRQFRCYADRYYHSVINYNGKVYKCTLHMEKEDGILHENGAIEWNKQTLVQLYSNATFENEKCLKCKYLPLCFGPCSQVAKSKCNLPCYYDMGEIKIEQFIIEMYKRQKEYAEKLLIKNKNIKSHETDN